MLKISVKTITIGAIIAALYVTLTFIFYWASYGIVQFRVSEALCILPVFTPLAIPGLFVGCLIANIFDPSANTLLIIFGTIATLLASILTRKLKGNIWLAVLPPIVVNSLVVGPILATICQWDILIGIGSVGIGEAGVLYLIGVPLYFLFKKHRVERFLK